MKKPLIFLILIIVLFLTNCNSTDYKTVKEIVVKEVSEQAIVSFEKVNSIKIEGINYPSLYLRGNNELGIWGLTFEKDEKFIIRNFDLKLTLLNEKLINMGQGPGDLNGTVRFFLSGEKVYVQDNVLRRVSIFDRNLNFIKLIKTPPSYPATFIKNGNYYLCINQKYDTSGHRNYAWDINLYSFPDLKKTFIYRIGPYPPHINKNQKFIYGKLPGFHFFYQEHQNRIYYLNMKEYRIITFNPDGKMLSNIKIDVNEIKIPEEKKKVWLKTMGRYFETRCIMADIVQPASWMVPLKKGFVVVRRKGYGNECSSLTKSDYFDYQLNLIGKIDLPCFYKITLISQGYFPKTYKYKDGYLYLINEINEDFFLEKWKVNENIN